MKGGKEENKLNLLTNSNSGTKRPENMFWNKQMEMTAVLFREIGRALKHSSAFWLNMTLKIVGLGLMKLLSMYMAWGIRFQKRGAYYKSKQKQRMQYLVNSLSTFAAKEGVGEITSDGINLTIDLHSKMLLEQKWPFCCEPTRGIENKNMNLLVLNNLQTGWHFGRLVKVWGFTYQINEMLKRKCTMVTKYLHILYVENLKCK